MPTMKTTTQEYRTARVDELTPHPENPRQGDVGAIHTSIETNGFYGALIVQKSTGHILAGNHRLVAAVAAGAVTVPILEIDVDDVTAKRILLADNRTNDLATYDNEALAQLLTALAMEDELLGTGYDGDDLDLLLSDLANPDGDPDVPEPDRGAALEVVDVSMAEPMHQCHHGDVWTLGENFLVVCDVHREWEAYHHLLQPGVIFAPYPTPMLAVVFTDAPLVMVQPSTYLAGHVLDKYASKHGEALVRKA